MIAQEQVLQIIQEAIKPGKILAGKTIKSIEVLVEGDAEGNITTYDDNIVYFGTLSVSAEDVDQTAYSGIAMTQMTGGIPIIFVENVYRPTEGNTMVNYIDKPFRQVILELDIPASETHPAMNIVKNTTCHFVGYKVVLE